MGMFSLAAARPKPETALSRIDDSGASGKACLRGGAPLAAMVSPPPPPLAAALRVRPGRGHPARRRRSASRTPGSAESPCDDTWASKRTLDRRAQRRRRRCRNRQECQRANGKLERAHRDLGGRSRAVAMHSSHGPAAAGARAPGARRRPANASATLMHMMEVAATARSHMLGPVDCARPEGKSGWTQMATRCAGKRGISRR